jgi:hypothetical protein
VAFLAGAGMAPFNPGESFPIDVSTKAITIDLSSPL